MTSSRPHRTDIFFGEGRRASHDPAHDLAKASVSPMMRPFASWNDPLENPISLADTSSFLDASIAALQDFAADPETASTLDRMAERVAASLRDGGKLLVAGNGGSAGDAQHIAGEFLVRLVEDRDPLPAIALTTDSSVLTAAGNDYGYDQVFSRQVRGLGRRGDVFLAISTSGNSPNILAALEAARAAGLVTAGFGGASGGRMAPFCDVLLRVPSATTAIIQQVHITAAHILCAKVEKLVAAPPDRS